MYDDKYLFKRAFILEILQLHPAIVWLMVALDILLFAAELFTFGLSYFLTIIISFLFGVSTIYVQMSCGDEFPVALSKGIITSIIILAPTSLLTLMYISLYMYKDNKQDEPEVGKEDSEKDEFSEDDFTGE